MNYYRNGGQMDLTDRVAIETGLCRGESFKKIAQRIFLLYKTILLFGKQDILSLRKSLITP